MNWTESTFGDACVLGVTGRLDIEGAREFERRTELVRETGGRLFILDMTRLEYLSSAGLQAMIRVAQGLKPAGGALILVAPETGLVRDILTAAGFDKLFQLYSSLEEATKHASETFTLTTSKNWGDDVLTVHGRVDAERAPELEAAGREILERGHAKLIVNLAAVEYLSSAGLCSLLNLGKLAQARRGRMFLCAPQGAVMKILELSGFHKIFAIRESVDEALLE